MGLTTAFVEVENLPAPPEETVIEALYNRMFSGTREMRQDRQGVIEALLQFLKGQLSWGAFWDPSAGHWKGEEAGQLYHDEEFFDFLRVVRDNASLKEKLIARLQ